MSCLCLQVNPIPSCIEELTIGYIDTYNVTVYVLITNISTGRIDSFETISDSDGLITIDVSEFEIGDDVNYRVDVYLATNVNGASETVTIDDVSNSCIYFTGNTINGVSFTNYAMSVLSNEEPPTSTNPRYHYTEVDYSVPSYIEVVGCGTASQVIHITMGNPNTYEKGVEITVKDEGNFAATNNIIIAGLFPEGNPQVISADGGAVSFYSNGIDAFYLISDI